MTFREMSFSKINTTNKLFLWVALLFILASIIFMFFDKAIDIQLHDTYFVLSLWHFSFLFSIIFGIHWLLGLATSKIIYSHTLANIYILMTIISLISIFFLILVVNTNSIYEPRRYYSFDNINTMKSNGTFLNSCWTISILTWLCAQILYITNISPSFTAQTHYNSYSNEAINSTLLN